MSSSIQHQPSTTTDTDTQQSNLDLAITLSLHAWPALTLAVQSHWGGPTSVDKRDWLCGAISDMLSDRPETDAEDLEEVLIQVMNDEFDVVIDDESAGAAAAQIMNLREQVVRGEYAEVQRMWADYRAKEGRRDQTSAAMFRRVEAREEDQETDEEAEEDECDEDVEMDEAPVLVRNQQQQQPREKVEPEVDEDGFTKVVGKKKR